MTITPEEINANGLQRYDRQCLIPGWDQSKLTNSSIAIIGSDYLSIYAGMTATALGFGRVTMIDDELSYHKKFMNFGLDDATPDVDEISKILNMVNPLVTIDSLETKIVNRGSEYFLKDYDIIMDFTNDSLSKSATMNYAKDSKKLLILGSNNKHHSKFKVFDGNNDNLHNYMHNFDGQRQDPLTSLPIAALAVEEVRKYVMGEEIMKNTLYYSPVMPGRFEPLTLTEAQLKNGRYSMKNALMVGAGALGNGIALMLPYLGIHKVYVVDADTVEETNLNRQVLFYNNVGSKKAVALSEKINAMGVTAIPIDDRFPSKRIDELDDFDIIFDCVDNFKARYDMSKFAIDNHKMLISGGTDYQSGQVAVFMPGKTSCISHLLNLEEKVAAAEERARQSCIYAPNPSVITSNMIVSGFMAAEARNFAEGFDVVSGFIKYGAGLEKRVGLNPVTELCSCYEKQVVDDPTNGGKKKIWTFKWPKKLKDNLKDKMTKLSMIGKVNIKGPDKKSNKSYRGKNE